jgi:hypothetical protein
MPNLSAVTAPAPILVFVTAPLAIWLAVMAESAILAVVTALLAISTVATAPSMIAAELTVLLPAIGAARPRAGTASNITDESNTTNFFMFFLHKLKCRAKHDN